MRPQGDQCSTGSASAAKLEQAYDILVPDRVRIVGGVKMTEKSNEDRWDGVRAFIGGTF
jgi:hypothetical protein